MQPLIFSSADSQSGFTNASTSASNDKDASVIIREILQNSYDSAFEDEEQTVAKVKFVIDYIKKDEIPGIDSYEQALKAIEKEDLSAHEQEQDILNVIKEQLSSDSIPVLYIIDNGIGFNQKKLVAILSDGISDKSNPNNAGGSYGNGHFSAFNISNLRYVLYGGKFSDGSKICSGQALLRTHEINDELKLGTGFLRTENKPIQEKNDIFLKDDKVPSIISKQLDSVENNGAVVGILGFNFFGNSDDIAKVIELITSSIVRNFFVAINENSLEVEISTKFGSIKIDNNNLDKKFYGTEDAVSTPKFNVAKRFYETLYKGRSQILETKEGEVKLFYHQSETDTRLALCRNGMWINDAIPSPLNKAQFIKNKSFNALVLIQRSTPLFELIRRAEGNLHKDIILKRFSDDKAGKVKKDRLQVALKEIRDFLANTIEENSNESFDVDIPELSINMIGETKSKKTNKKKTPKTKKTPKPPKTVINTDEENTNGRSSGKGEKDKSKTKQRVGNPFDVGKFNSMHNAQDKKAKLKFSTDKNATNLLLSLRLEDGRDPTCDGFEIINSPRLKILKASSGGSEFNILHDDTIDLGKIEKNTPLMLDIEYETNIKGNYSIDYEFLNSALKKDEK